MVNMFSSKLWLVAAWSGLVAQVVALTIGGKSMSIIHPSKREALQDLVTWDERSLFVRGERIMFFSGEYHPFRLPVPSLWLDVFQKIKSAGYNGVSFYVDWALLEGKPGEFNAEGVFAWEPFFDAAQEAGIYLIARPGSYINAEVSGGGFPGWLARYKEIGRTKDWIPLTQNYVSHIGALIAKYQITNGGPIVLFQPENELSGALDTIKDPFGPYMQGVIDQFRDVGIVVPMISNDAWTGGHNAPGSGVGEVDIYGHDGYPLGFDCVKPDVWPDSNLPGYYLADHLRISPNTPYTIPEYQGGSFDPWGGNGFDKCLSLLSPSFQRVFYKNVYAVQASIFSIYMTFGGTNWGNLGHDGGYTSYDYAASIAEDRTIAREKYSEIKLQANFFKNSPAYLDAVPGNTTNGSYVDTTAIATTRLTSNKTDFYIIRHAKYNSLDSTKYKLKIDTSLGKITIPQLRGSLSLNGRDSKIHVTDYDVGGNNLLYSSAEIFTWKKYGDRTVLVLYGAPKETHEVAFAAQKSPSIVEGKGVTISSRGGAVVLNWDVTPERKIVKFSSGLYVYLLDRYDAYNYWVVDLPDSGVQQNYHSFATKSVIARAGYLLRTASVKGSTLSLVGDVNATTDLEIIGGAPPKATVTFNGRSLKTNIDKNGAIKGQITFSEPKVTIPKLSSLSWKYVDSLPEVQKKYSDAAWPSADIKQSNNTFQKQVTPTSLFASDYGFHAGYILSRGHFKATGKESKLQIITQGGTGYAAAVYLDDALLQGFSGNSQSMNYTHNVTLPTLQKGKEYVLTVVNDHMGYGGDWVIGTDGHKQPRGIMDYDLIGGDNSKVSLKITGNLGFENYKDKVRGPLNEGGMWAERQGYHLPGTPTETWEKRSPFQGINKPGIGFFATTVDLNVPKGYDVPMSFVFANTTGANYRSQLYVNGWQFGKYVNNMGPQKAYPVPEGVLNYHGSNYIAVSIWGFDKGGTRLSGLDLVANAKIATGYHAVELNPRSDWKKRRNAY